MDIAIISEHASPVGAIGGTDAGGQNVYVAQIASHLSRLGHHVEVFTRRETPDVPIIQDLEEGFRLINVPAGPAQAVPKEKLYPYMKDFTTYMLNYLEQRQKRFDAIHANFWMSGEVAADVKKETGIPFAITFHALGRVRRIYQGDNDAFPDIRFSVEDRIVKEADYIIAECPQDYEDLVHLYKASEASIEIIPCGFDSNEMHPMNKSKARSILGLDPNEGVILHLGRMVRRKGADNVIRGFARFLKETKKKSRLVIVGGESELPDPKQTPEIGRLLQLAREEGVCDSVLFTGRRSRSKLKIYYSAADVFVTTPWYEPFGITPVEAMACGTPVIGSSVGGIKYTVAHNETGFLVPANDPESLKNSLIKLFSNEKLRKRFSRNAIERANKYFPWSLMAKKLEEVLSRMTTHESTYPLVSPLETTLENGPFISFQHQEVFDANAKSNHW